MLKVSELFTAQCGNYGNSLSHIFDKNFVKTAFLPKKLLKSWFHEIFFLVRGNFRNFHAVYCKQPWRAVFVLSLAFEDHSFLFGLRNEFSTFEMDYSVTTWKDPIFRQVSSGISYQPNVLRIERELPKPSKSWKNVTEFHGNFCIIFVGAQKQLYALPQWSLHVSNYVPSLYQRDYAFNPNLRKSEKCKFFSPGFTTNQASCLPPFYKHNKTADTKKNIIWL